MNSHGEQAKTLKAETRCVNILLSALITAISIRKKVDANVLAMELQITEFDSEVYLPEEKHSETISNDQALVDFFKAQLKPFNTHAVAYILQRVFQALPYDLMSNAQKYALINQVSQGIVGTNSPLIGTFYYGEIFPRPVLAPARSSFEASHFLSLISELPLPIDDFLVLTISFIENNSLASAEKVADLKFLYSIGKYADLSKHITSLTLPSDLALSLATRMKACLPVDLRHDHGRRCYETFLSAYYLNNAIDNNLFDSIARLAAGILGRNISDTNEMIEAVYDLGEIFDKKLAKRYDQLKAESKGFKLKSRKLKSGVTHNWQELQGNAVNETIYSQNIGIFKSYSPCFHDFRSRSRMVNRTPDIYTAAPFDEKHIPPSPFIADLSGHTLFIVAVVEKYLIERQASNQSDRVQMENDINNLFLMLIVSNIKRGYHSSLEIIHVLNDKVVQTVFKALNIKVDPFAIFKFKEVNDAAFKIAADYTKIAVQKRLMHAHLPKP